MKDKYKFLIKSTGILTLSSFASKLLSFFLIPLYTYVLSTEDYGISDLITNTVNLLIPILTLNIIDSIVVFKVKYGIYDEIVSIVLRYVITSIIFVGILLCCNYYLNIWNLGSLSFLIFIKYVTTVCNDIFNEFAKAEERITDIAIAAFLCSLTVIFLNLLFLLVFHMKLDGFLLANSLGSLISVLFLIIRLKIWRNFHFNIDKVIRNKMVRYSIPLITTTIGWIINATGDRYVVTFFYGISVTGLLSVAYKIPGIISMFNGIFSRSWQVSAIKEYRDGNNTFYANIYTYLNFFLTSMASCFIAFDKIISKFLFSNDFYMAWKLVPFLVLGSIFGFIGGYLGPILSARMDNITIAKSVFYSSVLNIVLNISLSFVLGPQGVTIATMLSNIFVYVYRRRVIGDMIAGSDSIIYFSWMILIVQSIFRIYIKFELLSWIPIILIMLLYYKQEKQLIKKIYTVVRH